MLLQNREDNTEFIDDNTKRDGLILKAQFKMKTRALSLDALRGYAILSMVLSGTMAMQYLPAWMAHAQVPPMQKFDPTIFGITWVDLVFPFFLFAMGAAFPFSVGSKLDNGAAKWKLSLDALFRGVQLVYFAIFIQHVYPHVVSRPESPMAWLIALGSFVLMFAMFMNMPWKMPQWGRWAVKAGAFVAGYLMVSNIPYHSDRVFSLAFSNIIIIVLANMALFGTLAYIFTHGKPLYRIAILPFVMAVFLGSGTEGWVKTLYNFSPIPWAYKFYYLKYLFIVLPGSVAGEYLYAWIKSKPSSDQTGNKTNARSILGLSFALIVCNVTFLFSRDLVLNLFLTTGLIGTGLYLLRNAADSTEQLWKKLYTAGAYLLLVGLFFEAYEGGIRKDHSTYSYYFVTSGLAFYALLFFNIVCDYFKAQRATNFLVQCGQNPMIAYVGSSLVVMPLLHLLHVTQYFTVFNTNAFGGFLRGLLITSLVALLTMFFTRIKWFWRT